MNGQFKPRMWNYFAYSGPRTNNHLEGWHNRLKRIARKAHPNLYEVLELFQKNKQLLKSQLQAEGLHKAKRQKVIQREEKIKLLKDELTVILMGKEALNHTFLQLDTVLFHLIFRYSFSD